MIDDPVRPGATPERPEHDDSIQPVVRRRLRPEILVLILGLVFVAGAVAKPWGGNAPAAPASAVPATTVPAAVSTARSSASLLPSSGPADLALDARAPAPPSWADVSWRVLKTADSHAALGISTVGLTVVPYSGPYPPDPPRPQVSWASSRGGGATTVVTIPAYTNVFAFAATWPRSLAVSGVSVAYTTPDQTATGAPGIPIMPVPASEVVLAPPTSSPAPTALRSGQFWVAPSGYPIDIDPGTLALVWQLGPWSWPAGEYRITLAARGGPVVMNLVLRPA
jgi:hypothetical protein